MMRSMTAAAAVGSRKTSDQRGERQVRRHHQAAALVALADEAEQQVGTGLVEWNVAQFVADDDVKGGRAGRACEPAGPAAALRRAA